MFIMHIKIHLSERLDSLLPQNMGEHLTCPFTHQMVVSMCVHEMGVKCDTPTKKVIVGIGFGLATVSCHLCDDGEYCKTFQTFCKLFGWFGTRAGPGVE